MVGSNGAYGGEESEVSALRTELEHLGAEISRVRGLLEEYRQRLDRLQQLYGMDRYRLPRTVLLFGQPIPMQYGDIRERMDREFLLSVHDVPQVLLWIKRANRYFPFIQERIRAKGLPEDLKYVAIVESALRPKVRSYAGAAGLWQFMPATGIKYKLRRKRYVDERRDPVKSTDAALAYLQDLYEMFGDWYLSVAAYNIGEKKIQKELKRQKVINYYDLFLPSETERYVFRIAAAKIILSDPKAYGFYPEPDELYEPLIFEPVEARVRCAKLDLISLAETCGMTYRSFMKLNPHFRKSLIPRGRYTLYVPPDKYKDAVQFIKSCNNGHVRNNPSTSSMYKGKKIFHRIQPGETLSGIAQKYNVRIKAIQQWNRLKNSNRIYSGQRLTIYR